MRKVGFRNIRQKADVHFRSQHTFFPDNIDFIGRLENIEKDFQYIKKHVKAPIDLVHHPNNRTHHKHYSQYYDDETKGLISKRYGTDLKKFGYDF